MKRFLTFIVLLLSWGCRPDLPGRGCTELEDCFQGESCLQRTCILTQMDTDLDAQIKDGQVDAERPDVVPDGAQAVDGAVDGAVDILVDASAAHDVEPPPPDAASDGASDAGMESDFMSLDVRPAG